MLPLKKQTLARTLERLDDALVALMMRYPAMRVGSLKWSPMRQARSRSLAADHEADGVRLNSGELHGEG